ncbi:MAG: MATE family efflux transporter [Eubacteriales bacterium]|nr:MATE family efflux transporter [Eubacteriales bacterium]
MKDKLEMMEKGPVTKSILQLALPTMLGMVVQMIYNMTDTYFIGQTRDPYLVAGISLVMPLFFVIQGIGNIFAVGAASLISRQLGAKMFPEAKRTNAVSFYTTLILGAVMTLLLLVFRPSLMALIGTSPATYDAANDYFSIISLFAIPMVMVVALGGQLRSEGATVQATIGMAIGLGLNMVLDPIFILTLNMKAAGAAWATIIGASCSVLYYISFYLRKKSILSISIKYCKPSRAIYAETLKIGGPAALSQIVMSAASILNNNIAASFGDIMVAGVGVYMRVGTLCLMLLLGLTTGYQPFAGYNYGAKNYQRLKSGIKVTAIMSTVLACFFAVIFLTVGDKIMRFFIDNTPTVEAGTLLLHALCTAMPFVGLQLTLMVTFQALGKSVSAMIITLGRQCLLYVPLVLTLPKIFGLYGFAFAQPIADILTTVIAVLLSLSLFRHIRSLSDAESLAQAEPLKTEP